MASGKYLELAELDRAAVDQMTGLVVLDFGANWCPICQGFAPVFETLLAKYPAVRHLKVEDGKGKRLGRSFRVKLWPNLVFLRDGVVVQQLARPSVAEADAALRLLVNP